MAYRVIVMPRAKRQLEQYIAYTMNILKNKAAAKGIATDARDTKKRLSENAEMLPVCKNAVLAEMGYRVIRLSKYDFSMIYRIEDKIVYVDAMYHDLQDIDGVFR